MQISTHKSLVTKSLLSWYRKNARPFPLRKTHNPYRILVSEVMLQQTQASRVSQKYPEFLRRFPSFTSLAQARTADVIRGWAGMGYNNRALRLQQIAKLVTNDYGGRLPNNIEILQKLPGIGRYTAHALACFAYGQNTAVVDTNVHRIFTRLFPRRRRLTNDWEFVERLLPKRKAYEWNQALMELGRTICIAANPRCIDCPIQQYCPSAFHASRQKNSCQKSIYHAAIPDRIFRGRVVAMLCTLDHHQSIESRQLAQMIRSNFTSRQHAWFLKLLDGLRRDGLIQILFRRSKIFVSLPE